MSFKSHIPFHRQISGSLVFLYLSFIFIIGFTSFLLYQRNVQINELFNTEIPELEFVYQYKEHLKLNSDLVTSLNNSESAEQLVDAFTNIKQNLKDISTLNSVNVRNVNRLISELNDIDNVVDRIVANDSRNQTLKQTSIVQLNILVNTLIAQIDFNTEEQLKHHKKVTMNGVNGYIPAGNAIQYVEITRILNQLNKTLVLLDEAIIGFDSLSIKYSVDELEEITRKIDLAITTWLSALGSDLADMEVRNKIEDLQVLLNVEHRVLGKWYSHLRLSEEVFNRVQLINQKLAGLYPSINVPVNYISSDQVIPSFVTQVTDKINYKITVQEYYYGLIGLLLIGSLSLLASLLRYRSRVKVYGEDTVNLCESILSDDSDEKDQGEYVKTAEQLRIVGLIKQIQKPEHSENQYQVLQNLHQRDLNFINEHHHIVIWQYKAFSNYIDVNDFLKHLSTDIDNKATSWRHLFTRKSLAEVIAIAKNVRDSKIIQSYALKLKNGVQLEILIGFDGVSWFGTLSHHKKLELLKNTVTSLKKKNKDLGNLSREELSETIDRFSQMILRAMIQSQGSSIDINGSSLPVYRQLTRMLDWCGQTNIVTQLQSNPKSAQNIDISFKDELHAAVFNAMSEAHLQKNKVYLSVDSKILPFSNIDHLLFHRMLTSVIRVILAELFNATLKLDLQVIDSDTAKQTVQFSFTVTPSQPLKVMPDLVTRLVNEDRKSEFSSDIIVYLNALMPRLNINQVQNELHDEGFKVIFNMPLVAQDIHPTNKDISQVNLQNISIISLGICPQSQQVIEHHVRAAGAEIITLNNVEELNKDFTVQVLERKPVHLIVVNDDIAKTSLEQVKNYQKILPTDLQPKLFVMQSPINPRYHKQGVYNQISTPLMENSFLNQLDKLLKSNARDNLLIDAEVLSQYEYLPTRVEVLLAVSAPEEHQLLINILQWLGLHVHVVSQPQAMLQSWQSGRYLVLLSEFSQSPYIMLSTGKNIQRGVFTFKSELFDKPTGRLNNTIKHWKVSTLPNILDIKALVTLLEPWLKSQVAAVKQSNSSVKVIAPQPQSYDEFLNDSNKLDDADKEYLNHFQLLNPNIEIEQGNDLQSDILDMEKYALNQGSSELAAYMLDEYLDDIGNAIANIETATHAQSINDMQKPTRIILKLSEVMGANNLNSEIKEVKELLNDDLNNSDFSRFTEYTVKLRSHLKALKKFSDAI
ncbi:hypothetical protein WNY51_11035 [Pseudocolwellia sp. AS88]|uniref:hypothetical protein n=1 Tax=Pseudocolwellia sp. AS88 TaxID=3063958 RepID=UPI0026EDA364|nr:hypothetical protein [Pseudocolwellia sp. AS88]MDO7084082.1 hypothetical protein [Pseudocolwellia sp. AS88]